MDGGTDPLTGWPLTDGRTDGWKDRRTGKRTDGRMDGGTDPCMHGRADVGQTDGRTERENGGTVGWTEGRIRGQADGWVDGWMEGRTERENGRTLVFVFLTFIKNSLFRYKYARIS